MVRLQVILVTVSMVCSQALHARMETRAINWKLYAIPQLLAQKEQSKNNPDLVAQIDQELANRGFVATITLAKAPEGQEWVLKDKNITLEKPLGAPTERPSGAGEGQWFFVAPDWFYFEKGSSKILDKSGKLVGKIGSIDVATPAVAQIAPVSEQAQTIAQLQQELKRLKEQAGIPAELVTPEAPSESEAPAAPDAPEAPDFGNAPGAPPAPPGFLELPGSSQKSEKTLAPLSSDQMNNLTAEQKNNSDALLITAIKKMAVYALDNSSYMNIIKTELEALANNPAFYKRAELAQLIKDGIKNCFNAKKQAHSLATTKQSVTECMTEAFSKPLFDRAAAASFDNEVKALAETMTTTSDELFKQCIRLCITTFPKEITGKTYVTILNNLFAKLNKEPDFYKKDAHAFPLRNFMEQLQDIDYDSQNPQLYLTEFNSNKEAYFKEWLDACNNYLFDATPDLSMEDDIRWIISFIVAAGRGERDLREFVNSKVAEEISDHVIIHYFIQSNPATATVQENWLPALRDFLTDPNFLKPYGLMVDAQSPSAKFNPPLLEILRKPASLTIKNPSLQCINSISKYLTFNDEKAKKDLSNAKEVLDVILLKPRFTSTKTKTVEQRTPEMVGASFAQDAFAAKTLTEVIEQLSKIKGDFVDLKTAINLLKTNPDKLDDLAKNLASIGFSERQIGDIKKRIENHKKHFELLKYLTTYMQEYNKEVSKNPGYKKGNELYRYVKDTLQEPTLVAVFEKFDREADAVYSAIVHYLKAIPNSFTRTVPAGDFRKTIEPYGILMRTLTAFNEDMSSPAKNGKALSLLVNALTALNTAKITSGTDYPEIITNSKDTIENQKLYAGKLTTMLDALAKNDFANFITELDAFVADSGTIAKRIPDGTIERSADYAALVTEFQQQEKFLLLNSIKEIVTALNTGNYTALPGFAGNSFPELQARAALHGSLTPLVTLLGQTKDIDADAYQEAYRKIINAPEFLRKANLLAGTKEPLKKSVLKVLDETADRLKALQNKAE
ncbi:hypothetical protein JST99_02510 [Candidatus Dependentiae bacterium]|nr:hypothetical protein [Candidatus Dependentiae bacterium]MCC7414537.1 hypothetical protein [Campylobacterota bacterium]